MGLMNDREEVSCFCLWKEQELEGKKTEVNFKNKALAGAEGTGVLVGKGGQSPYLRFAVLWFLLLLGSSWFGWGGGSGCFKKIHVKQHLIRIHPQVLRL